MLLKPDRGEVRLDVVRAAAILGELLDFGKLTGEALSRRCGAPVRTIYRDVEKLAARGVPVLTKRGRDGCFYLDPEFAAAFTSASRCELEMRLRRGLAAGAGDLGQALVRGSPAVRGRQARAGSILAEA